MLVCVVTFGFSVVVLGHCTSSILDTAVVDLVKIGALVACFGGFIVVVVVLLESDARPEHLKQQSSALDGKLHQSNGMVAHDVLRSPYSQPGISMISSLHLLQQISTLDFV